MHGHELNVPNGRWPSRVAQRDVDRHAAVEVLRVRADDVCVGVRGARYLPESEVIVVGLARGVRVRLISPKTVGTVTRLVPGANPPKFLAQLKSSYFYLCKQDRCR